MSNLSCGFKQEFFARLFSRVQESCTYCLCHLYFTGTDRNNMVETDNSLDNYPLPWEVSKLFQGATAVWSSLDLKTPKPEDIAVSLASVGTVYALNSTFSQMPAACPKKVSNNFAPPSRQMMEPLLKRDSHLWFLFYLYLISFFDRCRTCFTLCFVLFLKRVSSCDCSSSHVHAP